MTDHSDGAAGNEARTSNGARAASATGLLSRPIAAVANKNVWQARQQARVEAEEREKARQREEQERERRNNNEARVAHKQQTQQHAPSPWNKTHTGPGVMVQSPPMHHHQRTQAWQHPMQQSHARSSHHPPHHPHQYHHQPQSVQSAVSFTSRLHHYFHQVLLPSIRPVQWEVDTIEMGRRTIEGLIQSICPGGRLVPFGSMVNRLALRNSGGFPPFPGCRD